jgi:hypothetical protein
MSAMLSPPARTISALRPANWRLAARGDEHGPALRRARDVERAARLVELALEVDDLDLRRVDEGVGTLVHDDGIRRPGVPQLAHALDIFIGHVVAQVVLDLHVEAVVLGCGVAGRGHDVPGDAAAREVIERAQRTCQQPRRIEGRGERGGEANVLGRRDQVRRQHHGIELRRHHRVLEIEVHLALVGVGHSRGVLEDEDVEAGALQRAGGVDEDVRLGPVVARRETRFVPALDRDAGSEKPSEVKHTHGELR